jgi:hypothetical protein
VGDYDPDDADAAAAAFLGLSGTVELGSLDQVLDVAAYTGFHRCPVLVCSKGKEKGKKNTCYRQALRKSVQVSLDGAALLRSAQVYLNESPRRSRGG